MGEYILIRNLKLFTVSTPQKMIMTTQQGQQMIVTQVPRQHHVIVNQHTGNGKLNANCLNLCVNCPSIQFRWYSNHFGFDCYSDCLSERKK